MIRELIDKSGVARQGGDPEWWRPLEASLALLGAVADDIRAVLEEDAKHRRTPTFDLPYLFDHLVPGLLDSTGRSVSLDRRYRKLSRDRRPSTAGQSIRFR